MQGASQLFITSVHHKHLSSGEGPRLVAQPRIRYHSSSSHAHSRMRRERIAPHAASLRSGGPSVPSQPGHQPLAQFSSGEGSSPRFASELGARASRIRLLRAAQSGDAACGSGDSEAARPRMCETPRTASTSDTSHLRIYMHQRACQHSLADSTVERTSHLGVYSHGMTRWSQVRGPPDLFCTRNDRRAQSSRAHAAIRRSFARPEHAATARHAVRSRASEAGA